MSTSHPGPDEPNPEPERVTYDELLGRLHEDGPAVKGLGLSVDGSWGYLDLRCVDVISTFPNNMVKFGMLCEALRHRASLKKLVVNGYGVDDTGIASGIACLLLDPNTSIVDIQLNAVIIGLDEARQIGKALSENSTLQTVNISWCGVGDAGGRELANGLGENVSIESFALIGNFLRDLSAAAFGNALARNETLKELNLTSNDFSSFGLTSIAQALCRNAALERLFMRNENDVLARSETERDTFDERAAAALSKMVKKNNTLKEIDLVISSYSGVGTALEALAGAIETNTSLEKLSIGDCMSVISDAGANLFVTALRTNHTLKDIGHDKITGDFGIGSNKAIQEEIERLLSYNRAGRISARVRKTGECPPDWFERNIPVDLAPVMLGCLDEMSGDYSTSALYHFVREHKSILALIKSCAETNRRKRKAS